MMIINFTLQLHDITNFCYILSQHIKSARLLKLILKKIKFFKKIQKNQQPFFNKNLIF